MKKKTIAAFVTLTLLAALHLARPAQAADGEEIGLWIGAGFCSLIYTPIKASFFLLMGIAGGLSMFGTVPADRIDISADMMKIGLYGAWLVRPDHFTDPKFPEFLGTEEEFHFITDLEDSVQDET